MFKVTNNNIKITRGDSCVFNVTIKNTDGSVFEPGTYDSILLTVKSSTSTSTILIQKTVVDGKATFDPADTASLTYGEYVYDVQLKMSNGYTDTVITPHKFIVTEEVTF